MEIKAKTFLETDANRALRIREYLEMNHIAFSEKPIHDLTHFDIENLTDDQANELKKYYKQLEPNVEEKRHRTWDDKYHTLGQSVAGFVSGKIDEEEIER